MKYLFILALTSCSVNVNHKVSGEATIHVKVEIDAKEILDGFTQACEESEPNDVYNCVNKQIGDYFRTLASSNGSAAL